MKTSGNATLMSEVAQLMAMKTALKKYSLNVINAETSKASSEEYLKKLFL
jgi:hypothetical protein